MLFPVNLNRKEFLDIRSTNFDIPSDIFVLKLIEKRKLGKKVKKLLPSTPHPAFGTGHITLN